MTLDQFRSRPRHDRSAAPEPSLLDRLAQGEAYAVSFGGQGGAWLHSFAEVTVDADLENEMNAIVVAAEQRLAAVADELARAGAGIFDPIGWMHDLDEDRSVPSDAVLADATVSMPGVLLSQLATIASAAKQGLDTAQVPPIALIGHSQGRLATEALAVDGSPRDASDADLLALARLIGAAATLTARRRGLAGTAEVSPMLSVSQVVPASFEVLLAQYVAELPADQRIGAPAIAVHNSRRALVLSGAPRHLAALRVLCEEQAAASADERKRKLTGGSPFAPVFENVMTTVPFHHPDMVPGVALVVEWAQACGIDPALAHRYADAILCKHVDWVAEVAEVVASGARWILDFGPADIASRLSASLVRGQGVGLVAVGTRGGQRNLFVPGNVPEISAPWALYAPRLAELPDGRTVVDTPFTRLTGRSPMMLAGMTPTTVDPAIVAAAANAGHWAELAGGGQVTEEIFADNLARLAELLDPGREVQFNSLFLDPNLWKLQLGGRRLVQKARAAGAPIDGVIVTAGIPELDEAVDLVHELNDAQLHYVSFKPGTVEQIRAVVRIANEVPEFPIIVQVEGGRAGGHHSWEDLDDLLLATYGELRDRPNVVICVGGGIGTPERAAD